jgi:putative DNA primase/helicase
MVAAKHQESTDQNKSSRIFCRAKSNIGPDDGGFEYELSQTELKTHPGLNATYIGWVAKLEGEARDLLAAADAVQSDGDGGTLGDAKRFLTSLLEDGPMPVKEIQANARGAGYSEATIRRAKDALKVEPERIGNSHWEWRLPISAPPNAQVKVLNKTEDAHQKSVSTFDNYEHLQIPTAGYSIEI